MGGVKNRFAHQEKFPGSNRSGCVSDGSSARREPFYVTFAASTFGPTARASSCLGRGSAATIRGVHERTEAVPLLPLAATQHISELSYMGRNSLRVLGQRRDWILYHLLAGGAEPPPSSLPRDGRQQASADTDVKLKSNLSQFGSGTHL